MKMTGKFLRFLMRTALACYTRNREIYVKVAYYCNSLLAGLPKSSLEPLQRVQNAAARLVFGSLRPCHTEPYPTALVACYFPTESNSSCAVLSMPCVTIAALSI